MVFSSWTATTTVQPAWLFGFHWSAGSTYDSVFAKAKVSSMRIWNVGTL